MVATPEREPYNVRRTKAELAALEAEVVAISELRVASMRYLAAHGIPEDRAFEAIRDLDAGPIAGVLDVLDAWLSHHLEPHRGAGEELEPGELTNEPLEDL